jgi:hypothetical protein
MAQEKHLKLSHFKPKGYPAVYPGTSAQVKEMMPYLITKVSRGWTKIPHYDLEAYATRDMNVPYLGFRKGRSEVYIHVFCNEFVNPLFAAKMVVNLYQKFNLGEPTFSQEEPNWIHTIPLPGADLSPEETLVIHQITQSLFWTIYMDYKRTNGG